MGLLLPDNRTLVQMQPVYRCSPGAPLLAKFGNSTDGCPQQFPNVTDILGDGALGSHGGSGLSGFGGSIRLGELKEGSPPIRHALKLELYSTGASHARCLSRYLSLLLRGQTLFAKTKRI